MSAHGVRYIGRGGEGRETAQCDSHVAPYVELEAPTAQETLTHGCDNALKIISIHIEKQYLWRDPVFVDIFGTEFFPPQYTTQSRLLGLEGVARSLDLILRVSRLGR